MYPFRWVFSDSAIAAEIPFRDLRFGTVILLSFTAVLTIFGVAITQMARPMTNILQLASSPHRCCIVFLNVYALVAFILWVTSFGIYRYTVPLEMISGVLIVLLLLVLVRRSAQAAVLITMTVFLIVSTQPLMWGRGQWAERFINVEMPPVPGNALLVLIGGEPMGYIGAFVPPSVRVIGIENNFITSEDKTGMAIEIRNMLHNHPGPIFAVIPRRTNPESRMLDESGLRTREHDCAFVTTNIDDGLRLCQLVRDSNSH
ncbi:MAG: hypothetical protein LAT55_13120 [Opitutales bacterium]|nr:hypothetical protein [Opitutales bacterium]